MAAPNCVRLSFKALHLAVSPRRLQQTDNRWLVMPAHFNGWKMMDRFYQTLRRLRGQLRSHEIKALTRNMRRAAEKL